MQACSYTTIDSSIGKALFSRAEEQSQCLGSDRNTTVGGADPFIPSISISTSCAASKGGTYGIDYKLPATDFGMGLTPSSTTCQPLPASFTATIQNASRNGFLNECLLFGNNGADTSPTRMLWGSGNNGYCGFGLGQGTQDSPEHALEVNGQAVWNFSSQGGGVYVITGYGGRTLADGELAWTLNCVGNNQYTILNQFTNQCLIFTNNGAAPKPTQFNWGNGGSAAYCGLQSASSILANRQAAFTIDVQRVLR
jgi:hypothetical protein